MLDRGFNFLFRCFLILTTIFLVCLFLFLSSIFWRNFLLLISIFRWLSGLLFYMILMSIIIMTIFCSWFSFPIFLLRSYFFIAVILLMIYFIILLRDFFCFLVDFCNILLLLLILLLNRLFWLFRFLLLGIPKTKGFIPIISKGDSTFLFHFLLWGGSDNFLSLLPCVFLEVPSTASATPIASPLSSIWIIASSVIIMVTSSSIPVSLIIFVKVWPILLTVRMLFITFHN